jgi:hypothetical protein
VLLPLVVLSGVAASGLLLDAAAIDVKLRLGSESLLLSLLCGIG